MYKSKGCFGIVRSLAFQNTPYFLSGMHFKGLKTPKTKWEKIRETPCITIITVSGQFKQFTFKEGLAEHNQSVLKEAIMGLLE